MKKLTTNKILAGVLTVFMLSILVLPASVFALDTGLTNVGTDIGLAQGDLKDTINNLIKMALSFLGLLAVIIILWGGFLWMTAAGDDTKLEKAKKLILSGIVGVVIILAAYIIASFVINTIGGQLGASSSGV